MGSINTHITPKKVTSLNAVGGLIYAYNTGTITLTQDLIARDYDLSSILIGLVNACIIFGALIGSALAGILCDIFGRKKALIAMSIICTVAPILCMISMDLVWLCVMRVVLGLGLGLASVTCPLYVSEMTPQEHRGVTGGLFQLFLTFGLVIAYLVSYGIRKSDLNDLIDRQHAWNWDWRLIVGLGTVFGLMALILVVTSITESTYWKNLKGSKNAKNMKKHRAEGWKELFKRKNAKHVLFAFALSFALQFTGLGAVFYYGPLIFEEYGLTIGQEITLALGAWNFLVTFGVMFMLDKFPRKLMMIVGMSTVTVANGLIAAAFLFHSYTATLAVVCVGVGLFIIGFETGPGALFWVLASESFPDRIRDSGSSLSNILQWLFNLIIALIFPILQESIGPSNIFWIFTGIALVSVFYFVFLFAETKDRQIGASIKNSEVVKGEKSPNMAEQA